MADYFVRIVRAKIINDDYFPRPVEVLHHKTGKRFGECIRSVMCGDDNADDRRGGCHSL